MTQKYIVFVLIVLGSHPGALFGQWTFSEVVSRLSQEKAKLVSYRMTMHQTPIGESKSFANCTWVEERSNIGDHHVIALIKRNANGDVISWGVRGRSDEVIIRGASDTGKLVIINRNETSSVEDLPKHLDWRIIGLGICGDVGDSFETVCTNISNWDKDFPDGKGVVFKNTKTGIECRQSDIRFVAEIADGFRILSFTKGSEPVPGFGKSNYSNWEVDYKKQKGIKLPSISILKCGLDSAKLECIWETVNEPLEIGPKTADRFAKVLQKPKLGK